MSKLTHKRALGVSFGETPDGVRAFRVNWRLEHYEVMVGGYIVARCSDRYMAEAVWEAIQRRK